VVQKLKELRSCSRIYTWNFYHDNTRLHSAQLTQEFLANSGLKVLKHSSYGSNLALCDFGLYLLAKQKLKGRKNMDQTCADLPEEKWQQIFTDWFIRMKKYKDFNGNYFEQN
ncbi:hypothetical protein X777_00217, partial [Ooceraea biroi]